MELESGLQQLTQNASTKIIIERIYTLLSSGYSFLYDSGKESGHWGEFRSTALAAICLEFTEREGSLWLGAIESWLRNGQISREVSAGSWGEEIWDTSMCVLALKALRANSKDDSIQKALKWISSLHSRNGRNNWHDEPWETSWALLAILTCGLASEDVCVLESVHWLRKLQGDDGKIIAPHYTAYFLLVLKRLQKYSIPSEDAQLLRMAGELASRYLVELLASSDPQRLWTGEAWSNGQILWALCEVNSFPLTDASAVEKTLEWFEQAQEKNGQWSDVEDTSSALLGLLHLLLETLPSSFGRTARREITDELRRRINIPRLYLSHPLVERQQDGTISINLSRTVLRIFAGIVAVLGILRSTMSLVDLARSHHWIR